MSNNVEGIDIEGNSIYYFSSGIIDIENLDSNNIKIEKKSCKKVLFTVLDLRR